MNQTLSASTEVRSVVLRPPGRWSTPDFREIWEYRDLLFTLASRDIKVRYKQTFLGVAWVLLQPILAAAIFQVLFAIVAKIPTGEIPPFVFNFCGFVAYNAFSITLGRTSNSLYSNTSLVSKIYFPRFILPLSTVISTWVDLGVSTAFLGILLIVFQIMPGFGFLLFPLWLLILQMMALGLGLYFSAITVRFRDVQYLLPIIIQLSMYISPVAYSVTTVLSKLPGGLKTIFYLNPLAGAIDAFRWSLLGTPLHSWALLAYSALFAVLVLVIGSIAFTNMEHSFADVI